jgi:hypothetical protein
MKRKTHCVALVAVRNSPCLQPLGLGDATMLHNDAGSANSWLIQRKVACAIGSSISLRAIRILWPRKLKQITRKKM